MLLQGYRLRNKTAPLCFGPLKVVQLPLNSQATALEAAQFGIDRTLESSYILREHYLNDTPTSSRTGKG